jgi:hypothetical protein
MTVKSFANENKKYRKCMPHLPIYALPTEKKKLRSQMLIDFAKLQGYEPHQLRRLKDVLARAKDMNEAISEFRQLNYESKRGEFHTARSEAELMEQLGDGWDLMQNLNEDKFPLRAKKRLRYF